MTSGSDTVPYRTVRQEDPSDLATPQLHIIDTEAISSWKVVFRVTDSEGLREKLDSVRGFTFDERSETWAWLRKRNGKLLPLPAASSGTVTVQQGRLVGETGSEEGAIRLMNKIKGSLRDSVCLLKVEAGNSGGEVFRQEGGVDLAAGRREPFSADPDTAAEKYFHNEWIRTALPALGHRAPIDAVKTPEGRRRVREILDNLRQMQAGPQSSAFRVDVDGLRRRLGISVR